MHFHQFLTVTSNTYTRYQLIHAAFATSSLTLAKLCVNIDKRPRIHYSSTGYDTSVSVVCINRIRCNEKEEREREKKWLVGILTAALKWFWYRQHLLRTRDQHLFLPVVKVLHGCMQMQHGVAKEKMDFPNIFIDGIDMILRVFLPLRVYQWFWVHSKLNAFNVVALRLFYAYSDPVLRMPLILSRIISRVHLSLYDGSHFGKLARLIHRKTVDILNECFRNYSKSSENAQSLHWE